MKSKGTVVQSESDSVAVNNLGTAETSLVNSRTEVATSPLKGAYSYGDRRLSMSKYCPKCGVETSDDARFCLSCGSAFPETVEIIQKMCSEFLARVGTDEYKVTEKLLNTLGIPQSEKVLLAHDDSFSKSGKDGFVITEKGIYCREFLQRKTTFTTFSELQQNASQIAWGDKLHTLIKIGNKTLTYYTSVGNTKNQIMQLLKSIAKTEGGMVQELQVEEGQTNPLIEEGNKSEPRLTCPACGGHNCTIINEATVSGKDFSLTKGCLGIILLGPIGLCCGKCGEGRSVENTNYWVWLEP